MPHSDKSYVALEQAVCAVCGATFDTGNILMDLRLRDRLNRHETTGYGLCREHQGLHDNGYIALVEINEPPVGQARLHLHEAERTGRIMHARRDMLGQVLTPGDWGLERPLLFINHEAFEQFVLMAERSGLSDVNEPPTRH